MKEFLDLIKDIEKAGLQNAVFSNPIDKEKGSKITVHPILLKGEAVYQRTNFIGTKVFHENLVPDRLAEQLTQDMQAFKQAEFTTPDFSAYVLVSKKGKMTIKKKMKTCRQVWRLRSTTERSIIYWKKASPWTF